MESASLPRPSTGKEVKVNPKRKKLEGTKGRVSDTIWTPKEDKGLPSSPDLNFASRVTGKIRTSNGLNKEPTSAGKLKCKEKLKIAYPVIRTD